MTVNKNILLSQESNPSEQAPRTEALATKPKPLGHRCRPMQNSTFRQKASVALIAAITFFQRCCNFLKYNSSPYYIHLQIEFAVIFCCTADKKCTISPASSVTEDWIFLWMWSVGECFEPLLKWKKRKRTNLVPLDKTNNIPKDSLTWDDL